MSRLSKPHLLIALALAGAFALGALLPAAFGQSKVAPTVVRSALAQSTHVEGAPNRTLALSRVTIDPGATLATHHHLGTQVARVQSGVLSYTVRRGSVVVRRGASDENPKVVRSIKAGQTGLIHPGEWIVEQPSDIHEAANRGSTRIVIYLATLLETGAPPATPVTLPAGK